MDNLDKLTESFTSSRLQQLRIRDKPYWEQLKSVKVLSIKYLAGPNIWNYVPSIEVLINIGEFENYPSNKINNLYENLVSTFPSMIHHRCSPGIKEGFFNRVKEGTYFGHILEHIALELQIYSGFIGGMGRTRETEHKGIYKIALTAGHDNKEIITKCFYYALDILLLLIQNKKVHLGKYMKIIEKCENNIGQSTFQIIKALPKSMPYFKINHSSFIQLGYGIKQKTIWTSETCNTSGIAESISKDKDLTKQLLEKQGISVPNGTISYNLNEVYKIVENIKFPIVIKPSNGNHANGCNLNIKKISEIEKAFNNAIIWNKGGEKSVIVESYFEGDSYRITIVNYKVIACCKATIHKVKNILIGDGILTIEELVNNIRATRYLELYYKERDDEENKIWNEKISMEEESGSFFKKNIFIDYLKKLNYKLNDVLQKNKKLEIERTFDEYTDIDISLIHQDIIEKCIMATKIIGLDICGIDIIIKDLTKPLTHENGGILELNAGPGILIHKNSRKSVGKEIINYLFEGDNNNLNGFIPIIGITGNGNQGFVNKFISKFFINLDKYVGSYGVNGFYLNNKKMNIQNNYYWESTKQILMNKNVEIAIFDNDSKHILDEGVFYNKCNSIILGFIKEDLDSKTLINETENSLKVLRVLVDIVPKNGYTVLNGDDKNIGALAKLCDGNIIYYTMNESNLDNSILSQHIINKGKVVYMENNYVFLYENDIKIELFEVPKKWKHNINYGDILAAVGGIWSYHDIFNSKYFKIFNDLYN